MEYAEYVCKKHLFYVEKGDPNLIPYVYDPEKGIWRNNTDEVVLKDLAFLSGLSGQLIDKKDSIIRYIQGEGQNTIVKAAPPEILCFQNGRLNVLTKEFGPHTPDYFIINTLPCDYTPGATCPVFKDEFLASSFKTDDIPLIQEIGGTGLYRKIMKPIIPCLIAAFGKLFSVKSKCLYFF